MTGFSISSGRIESIKYNDPPRPLVAPSVAAEDHAARAFFKAQPIGPTGDLLRTAPADLVVIDPKKVVSDLHARYEILPHFAGLMQLMNSDALRLNNSREYVVQTKTRFPAGLYGPRQVTFVVPKDAPVPDGDHGHSCVAVEDPAQDRLKPNCIRR